MIRNLNRQGQEIDLAEYDVTEKIKEIIRRIEYVSGNEDSDSDYSCGHRNSTLHNDL